LGGVKGIEVRERGKRKEYEDRGFEGMGPDRVWRKIDAPDCRTIMTPRNNVNEYFRHRYRK